MFFNCYQKVSMPYGYMFRLHHQVSPAQSYHTHIFHQNHSPHHTFSTSSSLSLPNTSMVADTHQSGYNCKVCRYPLRPGKSSPCNVRSWRRLCSRRNRCSVRRARCARIAPCRSSTCSRTRCSYTLLAE